MPYLNALSSAANDFFFISVLFGFLVFTAAKTYTQTDKHFILKFSFFLSFPFLLKRTLQIENRFPDPFDPSEQTHSQPANPVPANNFELEGNAAENIVSLKGRLC